MKPNADSAAAGIRLENDFIVLRLDAHGRVLSIVSKTDGQEYCRGPLSFWTLKSRGRRSAASALSCVGDLWTVSFPQATAVFRVSVAAHYVAFRLVSVTSSHPVQELALVRLPVRALATEARTLNAVYDGRVAFGVMSLSLPVRGTLDEGVLTATGYGEFGLEGNGAAIIGCPFASFRQVIEEVETREGLPCIRLGGAWGKSSPDVKRSYLFIQDLSEENCDRVIRAAQTMNAGMIMVLESWCDAVSGHFPISPRLFPHGLDGLRRTVDRIHAAGMKAGLHYLAAGISANDAYVSPVPDPRLFADAVTTLAADITAESPDIPFTAGAKAFPEALDPRGVYWGNGLDLMIDEEVVTYAGRSARRPFLFSGCQRGSLGTRRSAHRKGTPIRHLLRQYGLFIRDLHTSLADEVAGRIGEVFTGGGFDMMYFDGSERLQGEHWYYNARLHRSFYQALPAALRDRVLYQGSSHSHFSWHMISRAACADGFKNVRDNVNNALTHYPTWFANLMPLDIGWYELGGPNVSRADVEYILCRSIGWDSSCGFETCLRHCEENPATLELIGAYERLRQEGSVPAETRALLRRPGAYHLVRSAGGRAEFVPGDA